RQISERAGICFASRRSGLQAADGNGAKSPLRRFVAAAIFLASCSHKPPPVERLAILKLDNLTGDASLDWMTAAASAILANELAKPPGALPMLVEGVRDATLQRVPRMAHGFFKKRGARLHFRVALEDATSHKIVREEAADGGLLDAMTKIAARIDSSSHAFSTTDPDALAASAHAD